MKKRTGFFLGALTLALLAGASLSSCSLLFSSGPGITGYVYDSFGNALLNVSVTATDNIGDSYTVTTDSTGKYFIPTPKQGTYTISASPSGGYYFTTPTYGVVYTKDAYVSGPTIAGVSAGAMATYDYIFVLTWNGSPSTLDLHMTVPTTPVSYGTDITSLVDSPSWIPQDGTATGIWAKGFGPISGGSGRVDCYYGNLTANGYLKMTGDVQNGNGGPVTIGLNSQFVSTLSGGFTNLSSNALFPLGTSQFYGIGELYVDAPSGNLSTTTTNSSATVYALYNSGSSITPFGTYTIPQGTTLATVSILRLNFLDLGIQVVPNLASVAPHVFESMVGPSANTSQAFMMPRRQQP